MNIGEMVAVLDLGSSKIACLVAGVDDKGRVEIGSMAYSSSHGIKQGSVVDTESAGEAVRRVVEKVEAHIGQEIKSVWVNISGEHLHSSLHPGIVHIEPRRRVKHQDVNQVVNHSRKVVLPSDREQILTIPVEFTVDGGISLKDPVGHEGNKLEVQSHLVSGSANLISNLETAITQEGRSINGLLPSSLASGLAVLSEHRLGMGAILVDIGAAVTDIGVFADGELIRQDVVPLGSDHVTRDIAQLLNTDHEGAENLKLDFGTCLPDSVEQDETVEVLQQDMTDPRLMARRMLAEIIESRMKEIAEITQKSLFAMGLEDDLPKSIFLTGGGSELDGTDKLFSTHLDYFSVKCVSPKVMGPFSREASYPFLATAIGLARYAHSPEESLLAPVSGLPNWKDKISTIKSLFTGKVERK